MKSIIRAFKREWGTSFIMRINDICYTLKFEPTNYLLKFSQFWETLDFVGVHEFLWASHKQAGFQSWQCLLSYETSQCRILVHFPVCIWVCSYLLHYKNHQLKMCLDLLRCVLHNDFIICCPKFGTVQS